MPHISFEVSAEIREEALLVATEIGISVEEIASAAFEVYLDGVRTAQRDNLDDESGTTSNVTQLEQSDADETVDLQGTEPWLSTEDEPDRSLGGGGPLPEFIAATADVRGEYRYSLTRVWDSVLPMITFVLLNPSTADAAQLDPTLRRCVGFAKREGYGGMVILNLYALRTKNPKVMMAAADPVGPDNDRVLAEVTGTVVAGWGANAGSDRVARVLALLPRLRALGVTKEGHPRHPLYVPADAPLIEWAPREP